MNEPTIIRARRRPDGTVVQLLPDGATRVQPDETDDDALAAMTEEEIATNALGDPDNPPMSGEELATFQRVPNPRAIRQRLRLTQEQFAERFHLRLGTIRDWKQGKKRPDSAARVLLRVIDNDPDAVICALETTSSLRVTERQGVARS